MRRGCVYFGWILRSRRKRLGWYQFTRGWCVDVSRIRSISWHRWWICGLGRLWWVISFARRLWGLALIPREALLSIGVRLLCGSSVSGWLRGLSWGGGYSGERLSRCLWVVGLLVFSWVLVRRYRCRRCHSTCVESDLLDSCLRFLALIGVLVSLVGIGVLLRWCCGGLCCLCCYCEGRRSNWVGEMNGGLLGRCHVVVSILRRSRRRNRELRFDVICERLTLKGLVDYVVVVVVFVARWVVITPVWFREVLRHVSSELMKVRNDMRVGVLRFLLFRSHFPLGSCCWEVA